MQTGSKIMYFRKLNNMTQADLSEQIGLSLKTLQRWETGKTSPNISELKKIAQVLNVPLYDLLDDTAKPQNITPAKTPDVEISTTENQLVFRDANRVVSVPNTPETRAMFERLVMSAMNGVPTIA